MSYLKFNPNLFLEVAELRRFKQFLDDEGFRRFLLLNSKSFGVVALAGGDNFKIEAGTIAGTIKIVNDSYAINSVGNLIVKKAEDNIAVTVGTWYWVIAKHEYGVFEEGTLDISAAGVLTGYNTKFTEVLRGQPNFPAKIKLWSSKGVPASNNGDYEVLTVGGNTTASLQGVFTAETGLYYSIVGTFTPGFSIPSDYKNIFQYDSCIGWNTDEGGFVAAGTGSNPTALTLGANEYVIAAIKSDGTNVEIRDYRRDNFYETKTDFNLKNVLSSFNYLIGVTEVLYPHKSSDSSKSLVKVEWGFNGTAFSLAISDRKVIITVGSGGKYKSVGDFVDNYFDGWRLYAEGEGIPMKISASLRGVGGTSIVLTLEDFDYDALANASSVLLTPDADEIEIQCWPKTAVPVHYLNSISYFRFPINKIYGFCELPIILDTDVYYYFSYRNITNGSYTTVNGDWQLFPSDSTYGYYAEDQHDYKGALIGSPSRTSYNDSGVKLRLVDNPASSGLHGTMNDQLPILNYTDNMDGGKNYILIKPGQNSISFDAQSNPVTLKGIKLIGYYTDEPPIGMEVTVRFLRMSNSTLYIQAIGDSNNSFIYPSELLSSISGKLDLSSLFALHEGMIYTFKFLKVDTYYKWIIKDFTSPENYGFKPYSIGFSYAAKFSSGNPEPKVHIIGLKSYLSGCISVISAGNSDNEELVATIPVNVGALKYRPVEIVHVMGTMYRATGGDLAWIPIPLKIYTTGQIYILGTPQNILSFPVDSLIYLDNISYFNTI